MYPMGYNNYASVGVRTWISNYIQVFLGYNYPSISHITCGFWLSSAAYMRQLPRSSWFQVMACRLFDAKPLPEPMLAHGQLDSWKHILVKFESEFYHSHSIKCNWKYSPVKMVAIMSMVRWVNICLTNMLWKLQYTIKQRQDTFVITWKLLRLSMYTMCTFLPIIPMDFDMISYITTLFW